MVLGSLGVAVIVTVAVEPACNETGPQLMLVFDELPLPQVPELIVAVMLVNCTPVIAGSRLAVTVTPLARSGPLFVTVYVKVAGLPALM
jgi:hypothetical protein